MDAVAGVSVGESTHETEVDHADAVITAGLQDFLARPVRIANFTWLESDATGLLSSISPWNLFFNNANIKYKLNNFAFIRCDLKIKIVVNASPFYYGAARVCYQPLPNFTPSTIVNSGNREFIPYSQQPGFWIKPQLSEGGEMTLPFFYQRNFLRAQVAQDFTDMGTLRIINYSALQSANGVTGQGVTVQVYAWAENVVIAGPSVGLAMQAQDEYGDGVVSAPASTVARIAGLLKGVPVIGKFATATEMGARAVSGIAKLFGFTNVPVIENTLPYRPSPFPQIASSELGYPVEKLTIDSKNELTIDPSSIGLNPADELSIQSLATRQSYLTTATWSTATPVDTPLFTSRVNCLMFDTNGATQPILYRTPLALLSQIFACWRGDIIFTFKFVASPFHKGRVRIAYDPTTSGIQTTGDTGAMTFNTIVDLGAETEVDVRIPYQQALAWMRSGSTLNTSDVPFSTSTTPTLTVRNDFDNGMISMKVLTLLSAPVGTSNVPIMVFVRAADNIEFANPQAPQQNLSPFVVQAMAEEIIGEEVHVGQNNETMIVPRSRVNFGEEIRSVRQLLRRSNYITTWVPDANVHPFVVSRLRLSKFPGFFGYDPGAYLTAKGLVATASNFKFGYIQVTPWHLISQCFVAHKGSAHWNFNVEGSSASSVLTYTRDSYNNNSTLGLTQTYAQAAGTSSANTCFYMQNKTPTGGGSAMTNGYTQAGLNVSMPNYTHYKFQSTNPRNFTSPPAVGTNADDGSVYEAGIMEYNSNSSTGPVTISQRVHSYFSVGTDYNLFFFLNVPVVYVANGTIIPN